MLGERLRELREHRGMTQENLASQLNVTLDTVSKYETEKREPNDTVKMEIAEIFNVSLDYLIGFDKRKNYGGKIYISYDELTDDDIMDIQKYADMVLELRKGRE